MRRAVRTPCGHLSTPHYSQSTKSCRDLSCSQRWGVRPQRTSGSEGAMGGGRRDPWQHRTVCGVAPHGVTSDELTLPHRYAMPAGPTVMSKTNRQHWPCGADP
jgi:hypothetical protein